MTMFRKAPVVLSRILAGAVVVALLALVVFVRVGDADARRVDAACGKWLVERDALRTAVSETDEAVERAVAKSDSDVGRYFNDLDREMGTLERWDELGARTRGELHDDRDASVLERGAVSAFDALNAGIGQFRQRIGDGDPTVLSDQASEVLARFQWVDDVCLASARQ